MNRCSFKSKILQWGGGCLGAFTDTEVKAEPQFFNASPQYAFERGGPITREFLTLSKGWESGSVFDSRVHMLMPGWYPCIPGWHLDDVPRERSDKQPNHVDPSYKSEHLMAIVGDASRTEFALGELTLNEPPIGSTIYGQWTKDVELLCSMGHLARFTVLPNYLYHFDWQSWHRGMPATKNGWRWFGRLSWKTERKVTNEIRAQTQVYLPAVDAGW